MEDAIAAFEKSGLVEYAEPDYIGTTLVTPNDPLYTYQWGYQYIGAPQAWDLVSGAPKIVVAVMDSGVRSTHFDLASNLWTNPNGGAFLHGINAIPDPATGYIGLIRQVVS